MSYCMQSFLIIRNGTGFVTPWSQADNRHINQKKYASSVLDVFRLLCLTADEVKILTKCQGQTIQVAISLLSHNCQRFLTKYYLHIFYPACILLVQTSMHWHNLEKCFYGRIKDSGVFCDCANTLMFGCYFCIKGKHLARRIQLPIPELQTRTFTNSLAN